jgi:hypothetical protein
MEITQKPPDTDNIIQTLMICNKYKWFIPGQVGLHLHFCRRKRNPQNTQQTQIKQIDTFFMRFVTQQIKTEILRRMKQAKNQKEKAVSNYRERIRDNFVHHVEISGKSNNFLDGSHLLVYNNGKRSS